uniref:Vesicle transport protein SEC20 n=1 Tax=Anthurium amnicola TaxID=1678845 RepID=A0A1D1Y428_9ARAE
MDEVVHAVEEVKREWRETIAQVIEHVRAIEGCGSSGRGTEEANALPRLNGAAQDGLASLRSLQFRLDLLAQQLPTEEEVQSAQSTLNSWKEQYESLRLSLRSANLQAKTNIRKAAQEERELLLGGGEESTIRRRNLQTKVGMTSAAESITESLRRTRQLMVQEVERSTNTLMTFEESTTVLKKAESEYKGHRSLLMRTRHLLTTMQRQDVLDRVILVVGFLLFSTAVLYVVSKRIGLLKLQRKITAAIKAGAVGHEDVGGRILTAGAGEDLKHVQAPHVANMHDEL